MKRTSSRRSFLLAAAGAAGIACSPATESPAPSTESSAELSAPLIESHLHLFAADREKFPLHPNAPYDPAAAPLEAYIAFAGEAEIDGAVIVHPEPYQDDHSYLEYCFENEPSPGFFKGTCLFDTLDPKTPERMRSLVEKYPGRMIALRVHEMHEPGTPYEASGPIRNRDMSDPRMRESCQAAHDLGLAIQMHFLPYYAPMIGSLIGQVAGVRVILDHLGRAGMGTDEQFQQVLELGKQPNVIMKYSGVGYSSNQPFPHDDARSVVERALGAFGADRLIWGGLGQSMEAFAQQQELFANMFVSASEEDKAKIRGQNAARLFQFNV